MSNRAKLLWALAIMALVLYGIGFSTGTFVVIVIAACVELYFWFKLFINESKNTDVNEGSGNSNL